MVSVRRCESEAGADRLHPGRGLAAGRPHGLRRSLAQSRDRGGDSQGPFPCLAHVRCSRLGGGRQRGRLPRVTCLVEGVGRRLPAASGLCSSGRAGSSPEQPSSSRTLVLGLYALLWNWPAGPPKMTKQWKRGVRRALRGGAEAEPSPGPRRLAVPGPPLDARGVAARFLRTGSPACGPSASPKSGKKSQACQVLGAGRAAALGEAPWEPRRGALLRHPPPGTLPPTLPSRPSFPRTRSTSSGRGPCRRTDRCSTSFAT